MGHENTDTASELREPQTQKEFKARVTAYRNIGLSALSQNLHDFAKGKFEELINETLSCVDRGRTKSDWRECLDVFNKKNPPASGGHEEGGRLGDQRPEVGRPDAATTRLRSSDRYDPLLSRLLNRLLHNSCP